MTGLQTAFGAENVADTGGISGAIAKIIGYAGREALFGIGKGHIKTTVLFFRDAEQLECALRLRPPASPRQ
jgi:hypothetical protein